MILDIYSYIIDYIILFTPNIVGRAYGRYSDVTDEIAPESIIVLPTIFILPTFLPTISIRPESTVF
jgi:hypothetical protein